MTHIDVDTLLAEISPNSPCGKDITYDVAFLELEQLVHGTAEMQVGDHIQESEEPDWEKVHSLSLELLEHSRDLRLINYLTISALCVDGLPGFCDGLALLRGMVERYWDHIFPQLDPEDDNDPLERINIISSLSPPNTVMSDQDPMKFRSRLMDVPLCTPDDARLPNPSLRHILVASGEIPMAEADVSSVPTMQLIDAAFEQTQIEALQANHQVLHDCLEHVDALDKMLIDHVGAAASPNLSKLEHLLKQIQSKIGKYLEHRGYGKDVSMIKHIQTKMGTYLERKRSNPNKSPADTGGQAVSPGNAPHPEFSGQVTSKQEVLKALDMIVNYYEQNEPSSPVPLLIKRAKRLVGKSFVDIIRDLSPDAITQVKMVSGEQEGSSEE